MGLLLEIVDGAESGRVLEIDRDQGVTVGRFAPPSAIAVQDGFLSNCHFSLERRGEQWLLRDLDSRFGTKINGAAVREAVVRNGDQIVAGQTTFRVRSQKASTSPQETTTSPAVSASARAEPAQPSAAPPVDPDHERILKALRQQTESLFALFDAARDPRIFALLNGSGTESKSLYEGAEGDKLAMYAPYLVRLPQQSPLLDTLIREGWGMSWGVFLVADQPLADVRKHFRRFLMVKAEDGPEMYFRFYDPRVLRAFLPACTPAEVREFFGPVRSFLVEARRGANLLRFTPVHTGVELTIASV
jgi:predicted component of type VI protein secretion system